MIEQSPKITEQDQKRVDQYLHDYMKDEVWVHEFNLAVLRLLTTRALMQAIPDYPEVVIKDYLYQNLTWVGDIPCSALFEYLLPMINDWAADTDWKEVRVGSIGFMHLLGDHCISVERDFVYVTLRIYYLGKPGFTEVKFTYIRAVQ